MIPKFILVLALFAFSSASAAAPPPLFSRGAEVFTIRDRTGKTPQFRALDDSESERALAMSIIAALNTQTNVQPKLPMQSHIDLKVESMTFRLASDARTLALEIKLSGYDLAIPQLIDKARFLAGHPIELKFPETERDVSLFKVRSSGRLRMRLDPRTTVVLLEDVRANMRYDSILAGDGAESIGFSGKAIRQTR